MATLQGQEIKDTYQALLKTDGNTTISSSLQAITDGQGNPTALSLSTKQLFVSGTISNSPSAESAGYYVNNGGTSGSQYFVYNSANRSIYLNAWVGYFEYEITSSLVDKYPAGNPIAFYHTTLGLLTGSIESSYFYNGEGDDLTIIKLTSDPSNGVSDDYSGYIPPNVYYDTTIYSVSFGTNNIASYWGHAEGYSTTAIGQYSHVEGYDSITSGAFSHAEGQLTTTLGESSHTEGVRTIAIGIYSHAEGSYTTAIGGYSHAEGYLTTALGQGSHAEGNTTTAIGIFSHAEGLFTTAIGQYSHTEGDRTTAIGNFSHAEGGGVAIGINSHAEGASTAIGQGSHAEGYQTISSGSYSHAEGYQTIPLGSYSHAEGQQTTAIGNYSHAEGNSTTAIGEYSHAEGYGAITSGSSSHAEGSNTIAIGFYCHAEGVNTTAIGQASHAEGQQTTSVGVVSHAEGFGTIASGSLSSGFGIPQHAEGRFNIPDATSLLIIGNGNDGGTRRNAFSVTTWGTNNVSSSMVIPFVSQSLNYTNDAAAAAGGVPVGGVYRSGSILMIRVS